MECRWGLPCYQLFERKILGDRQRISPEESNLALYSTLDVGSEVVHLFITQNKIYTHFDLVDIETKKGSIIFLTDTI